MEMGQKQAMSLTKKIAVASGISMFVALAVFFGLKLVNSEESMAGSEYVWNGNKDSDWERKDNWDGKKVPKKGSSVKIGSYNNAPIIEDKSFDIEDLELKDGAVLYVQNDLKVKGDLDLNEGSKIFVKGKTKFEIEGSLSLNGKETALTIREGEVKIKENLNIVSADNSDSTLVRLFGGFLQVKGSTSFLKDNSSGNGLVDIKGGWAQFNELVETKNGYDNGSLVYHVSGGQVDFYEDFIMEDVGGGSFTQTVSSPCDDATEWEKKSYNRSSTEPIYVTYKDDVFRMKPSVTYAGSKDKPSDKKSKIWEKVTCKDYCELAADWDFSKEYKRNGNGEEVYVLFKGYNYQLKLGEYWSKNEEPGVSGKWVQIKQCASYSAPTCGDVAEWKSTETYKRNNKDEVIEVFWGGKVYAMKTNKWYSNTDEPGKTDKIWQYDRDCSSSSSKGGAAGTIDVIEHTGGKIVFHKDWIRSKEFESKNDGTIEFKITTNKLTLKKDDKFVNLTIDTDVELDVVGNVDVTGELNVIGKCSGKSHIKISGSKKQKIKGGGKVANITFNNSNDVSLESDLTIEGELTLTDGDLEVADNTVVLNGNTSHGNSSSYLKINGTGTVNANVGTDPVIFPIGRNPYLPIIIDDGSGEEFSVGVRDLIYLDPEALTDEQSKEAVSETWYVQAGTAVNNVSITIGWDPAQEMSGFNSASCFISYWEEGVSTKWTASGLEMSTSENGTKYRQITIPSMSTNRYFFAIGSGNSALPVEFLFFDAKALSNKIELTWATATETNNDYFEIQRSEDGVFWDALEKVEGFGTTLQQQDYTAYDLSPKPGLIYYRLKQVDFDGAYDFSDVKQVAFGGGGVNSFEIKTIYPNPFSTFVNVEVNVPTAGDLQVELVNSSGVTIKKLTQYQYEGVQTITISELDGLEHGAYIVVATQNGKRVSKTILKK